jgi:superoxide reductase
MAERFDIYKGDGCGSLIEVLHGGAGDLVCCGQPMQKLDAKTVDEGKEKHVPVIEKVEGGVKVKVGDVPHPMEEKHYIELIEVMSDHCVFRRYLQPGDAPEATFPCGECQTELTAREHCTVHGLWTS